MATVDLDNLNLEDPTLEAETGGFKNPDEGWWRFRVAKSKYTTSGAGNPQIELRCEVVATKDGGDAGRNKGRSTRLYVNLNPNATKNPLKAREFLKGQFTVMRVPMTGSIDHNDFVDREFVGLVRHKEGAETRTAEDGSELPPVVFANIVELAPVA